MFREKLKDRRTVFRDILTEICLILSFFTSICGLSHWWKGRRCIASPSPKNRQIRNRTTKFKHAIVTMEEETSPDPNIFLLHDDQLSAFSMRDGSSLDFHKRSKSSTCTENQLKTRIRTSHAKFIKDFPYFTLSASLDGKPRSPKKRISIGESDPHTYMRPPRITSQVAEAKQPSVPGFTTQCHPMCEREKTIGSSQPGALSRPGRILICIQGADRQIRMLDLRCEFNFLDSFETRVKGYIYVRERTEQLINILVRRRHRMCFGASVLRCFVRKVQEGWSDWKCW